MRSLFQGFFSASLVLPCSCPCFAFSGPHVLCEVPEISCGLWLDENHWGGGMARGWMKTPQDSWDSLLTPWRCNFLSGVVSPFCVLQTVKQSSKQQQSQREDKDRSCCGQGGDTGKERSGPREGSWTRWREGVLLCRICQRGWQQSTSHDLKALFYSASLQDSLMVLLNLKEQRWYFMSWWVWIFKVKSVCVSKDELKEEKEFNVIGTKILKRLIKKKNIMQSCYYSLRSFSELPI